MIEARDDRGDKPSASGMDRAYRCPGCIEACRGLSELPQEKTAETGINVHDALETGDDEDLTFTEKQITDKIRPMELREVDNWRAACNISGPVTVIREGGEAGRFWIRDVENLDLMCSARPDVVYICAPYALVINYKTGFRKPTPSELSWQSKTEVIATWHETGRDNGPITHIRGAFLSSRISTHFDCTDYDLRHLIATERDITAVCHRAAELYAPRVPGPWCRYCKARGLCRENAAYSSMVISGYPLTTGRGGIIKADELHLALMVGKMTPPEVGYLYRRKNVVESVFDALAARLRAMGEDQLSQAGYSLGPGRPVRSVADGVTAFSRLKSILTEEERLQCISVSYTKAAELLQQRLKISEDEAKTRVLAALGDAITTTESAKKLKPIPKS